MRVILLTNIKGIGQIGDIKDVNDGYGRNFLIPRRLAKVADAGSVRESENLKKRLTDMLELERKEAQDIAGKLTGTTLELSEKANASGKLFAAVGKREIAQKLKTATSYQIAEDSIIIQEHAIKTVGEHTIELELAKDIKVPVKVIITAAK